MRVKLEALPLDTNGAQLLRNILVGERSNPAADALIAHVFELGARYAVLEHPYTDVDYSADYQTFYAVAFKDYPRQTQRLHLFSQDVTDVLEGPFEAQTEGLEQRGYLGFVVIRPISQGPIGRTVLNYPVPDDGLIVRRAARARNRVHLAGAELHVEGAPFIQQEAKVGACAQAAIWMAALPVHLRHRSPRFTIAEITRLAVTPTDAVLSRALPAGSKGLNPAHMIRALRGMGHQPLFDVFKAEGVSVPTGYAASMVLRYLDSSLPVILAMDHVGHAVTAVGYVETPGGALASGETLDVFTRALLVHDDQRGPYRLLPLRADDIDHLPRSRLMMHDDEPLTVETAVSHMFVPLPPRVFLPAHRADIIARDFLRRQAAELGPEIVAMTAIASQEAADTVERFYAAIQQGGFVRRTYLTSAARYRHHLAQSNASPSVKLEVLDRTLPHYVWVTELIPRLSVADPGTARPIVGHLVVNATSSSDIDSDLLVAHTPHVVTHRDINSATTTLGEIDERAVLIDEDHPYQGRQRR